MKVLIWILCFFANAIVVTVIKDSGIILGGIPTALLFLGTIWLARTLCKKWDEHKSNKGKKDVTLQKFDTVIETKNNQVRFCRSCGANLIDNSEFCRKCGAKVAENEKLNGSVITDWKFCKKCGSDISDDTDTCHVCGENID